MPKRRISEQNRAEAALRDLSARLLQVQDAERRRIARELHEVPPCCTIPTCCPAVQAPD
jgi:hypothetical protein